MRKRIYAHILNRYGVAPEYLWQKFPHYAVFRHSGNRKWFALIADVANSKLGLDSDGQTDIINLKLNPEFIDTLKQQRGFLPAYHMNKRTWLTVLLDGTVAFEEVCALIDESFALTQNTRR